MDGQHTDTRNQSIESEQVAIDSDLTAADELDDVSELDDVDFTLEEVESKIAPLALAYCKVEQRPGCGAQIRKFDRSPSGSRVDPEGRIIT